MDESVTFPLTLANLPHHPLWEADGSCWQAIEWPNDAGWRWQPKNWTAFAKEGPEGEMWQFPPGSINFAPILTAYGIE